MLSALTPCPSNNDLKALGVDKEVVCCSKMLSHKAFFPSDLQRERPMWALLTQLLNREFSLEPRAASIFYRTEASSA